MKSKLIQRIEKFLKEPLPSVSGGWPEAIPRDAMIEFQQIIHEIAERKFGSDYDVGPPVYISVTDRLKYEGAGYVNVPKAWFDDVSMEDVMSPDEYAALDAKMINLAIAQQQVDTFWRIYDRRRSARLEARQKHFEDKK